MSPSIPTTPVPEYEIPVPRGASATIRLAVTKGGVAQDLSTNPTVVIFTAKRKTADAAVVFQKSYKTGGAVLPTGVAAGGITNNVGVGVNVADVAITPNDTKAEAQTEILSWDAWVILPTGEEAPVAKGTIRLGALPWTPP